MQDQARQPWLIYGANGYTGRLIAAEAARRGMAPVVAGRNREQIEALAAELSLPSRVFPLDSVEGIVSGLDGIALVLNCAGPFDPGGDRMLQACIRRGVHYLDICGEPDVLERYFSRAEEAAAAGSVAVPAVGYDVVPSDTLARQLADRMPDAVSLELAFFGDGAGSAGSAKTVLGMMADKCKVRRGGRIRRVPLAWRRMPVRFSDREEWCMSIPWGDVSTAYYSTGIPDITVLMATPRRAARMMRVFSPFAPLLKLSPLRRRVFASIEQSVEGPDRETRERSCMRLWGRVRNAAGDSLEATMDTPEGFTVTTRASLLCVERVLAGDVAPGCHTPTQAFGAGLALEVPGISMQFRD